MCMCLSTQTVDSRQAPRDARVAGVWIVSTLTKVETYQSKPPFGDNHPLHLVVESFALMF